MNRFLKPAVAAFSALAMGAFAMPELRAQGGTAVSAPPLFQGDYTFAGSTQCLHSASASCRRKPRPPSQLNADFGNGTANAVGIHAPCDTADMRQIRQAA